MNRNICADLKTNWIKSGGSGGARYAPQKESEGWCLS